MRLLTHRGPRARYRRSRWSERSLGTPPPRHDVAGHCYPSDVHAERSGAELSTTLDFNARKCLLDCIGRCPTSALRGVCRRGEFLPRMRLPHEFNRLHRPPRRAHRRATDEPHGRTGTLLVPAGSTDSFHRSDPGAEATAYDSGSEKVRAARTGPSASRMTASVTLPSMVRRAPVSPRVPMTVRVSASAVACTTMSVGSPRCTR